MSSLAPSVYPILHNARFYVPQRLQSRPGMSKLGGQFAAGSVHSVRRLNESGSFTRILGAGGDLYLWNSTSAIDTGYSGNPLSMVPFRPSQSPNAWMYVADSQRMRKVAVDGTNYAIGIAPPLAPPSAELGIPAINIIDDTTAVGTWTNSGTAGTVSQVSRYSGTSLIAPLYDSGTTGWALIPLGSGTNSAIQIGSRVTIGSETFTVQDILPAVYPSGSFSPIVTIAGIAYDSGSSGPCCITLNIPATMTQANVGYIPELDLSYSTQGITNVSRTPSTNAVGLRRNCMLHIGSGSGAEYVRVTSVAIADDGTTSFRCSTVNTHNVGDAVAGVSVMRGYLVNNHVSTSLSMSALQSTIGAGTGILSNVPSGSYGLGAMTVVGSSTQIPVQESDIIHFSVQIDNAANLTEIRLLLDANSGTPHDFAHSYYFKSWSASDIQQALAGNTTIQQARQSSYSGQVINTNIGTTPVIPAGSSLLLPPSSALDPATVALGRGSNYPYSTKANPAGLGAWIELTCAVSDLTKVGPDATSSLNFIGGVAVQITVAASAVCDISDLHIRGGYGPDIGVSGVPYLYRSQPRSAKVGGPLGYPSPPIRIGIEPHRQSVVVTLAQHPDPQVDYLDVYRWGGTLPQWTYLGSVANSSSPVYTDTFGDLAIQSNPQLQFTNLQPFPTIDLPRSGTVNVVGTTIQWISGDQFNPSWAQGTQINIGGIFYTLYRQPQSAAFLQIVENAGTQSGATFSLNDATLLGQPLPCLWGPFCQGTALFSFACGDTYQPGVLFLTNGNDMDSASDVFQIEVTSPSEPLINGCMYNGNAYVFSSERLFYLYPVFGQGFVLSGGNLLPSQGTNLFTPQEVANGKGLFARYAIAVGPQIWFRARDGIYATTGGAPQPITVAELSLLFPHDGQPGQPVTVGTFTIYPPDDTRPLTQQLSYYDSMLYFDYIDTNGNYTSLVYDTVHGVWSKDDYSPQVLTHYGEEGEGVHAILLGGNDGNLYQLTGNVDGTGSAFAFEARMPQLSELRGSLQHVYDGYLGLQSGAAASLVINVDGTDNAVALPSTSGAYERIYTTLTALKGRLFAWGLLGTSPFTLFQRDCQFSMKTWADPRYTPVNPFSGATRAASPKVQ